MKDEIVNLQKFYLQALCALIEAEKFTPAIQEAGPGVGQLWLIRSGSTGAAFRIAFKFGPESVTLGALARGEKRELVKEILYFDGIEDFMRDLQKFLRADLLSDKRKAA